MARSSTATAPGDVARDRGRGRVREAALRVALVGAVAGAALVGAPVASSPAAAAARRAEAAAPVCTGTTGPRALGVYAGAGDPGGVQRFATRTGTHLALASDFLPGNRGWNAMTGSGALAWLLDGWRGSGCTLALGVPMVPTDGGRPVGSLAAGAAGDYDAHYAALARTLVAGGQATAVLRLGWEFNGNWFPWRVTDARQAADFAAYWRAIVTTMRAARGQAFRFAWDPDSDGSYARAYSPAQAYPGSAYVDDIGIDLYDTCACSPHTATKAWSNHLTTPWGLDWVASFAAAQGKPVVIPEWGLDIGSGGLGDDPVFVEHMASWVAAHDVAWTSYFNYDVPGGRHDLLDGLFPKALSAFRGAHFGTAHRQRRALGTPAGAAQAT